MSEPSGPLPVNCLLRRIIHTGDGQCHLAARGGRPDAGDQVGEVPDGVVADLGDDVACGDARLCGRRACRDGRDLRAGRAGGGDAAFDLVATSGHSHPVRDDNTVPTVLFVGRMDQEKRVDELIRAVAGLPAHLPFQLKLIGDGPQRGAWTGLAESLGIADRVRFRGFVAEAELLAAYARAAVFCMPGTAELQSLATLEAMASGTPVVAADAMALPHLVRPGRNGRLYTPGDVAGLTARLAGLLVDKELRRRMGQASRAIAAEHAIDGTLDTFEALYRTLARRRRVGLHHAA